MQPPRNALVIGPDSELVAQIRHSLAGWNVQRASSNFEALTAAAATAFDLIITGEDTSVGADVQLLRRIRSARPHTRMIILAGESTPEEVIASMRAQAFSCLTAPFTTTSLEEMI